MTQNERLRALLKEARECINTEWDSNLKTIALINAALAEPACPCGGEGCTGVDDGLRHQCGGVQEACGVPGCIECGRAHALLHGAGIRADNAERRERARIEERDEARAEVERLRALYVEARMDGFRDGRKVGAEAMREAAAQTVPGHYVMDLIQALPIPEDMP